LERSACPVGGGEGLLQLRLPVGKEGARQPVLHEVLLTDH
jgi:hypothetical protein